MQMALAKKSAHKIFLTVPMDSACVYQIRSDVKVQH